MTASSAATPPPAITTCGGIWECMPITLAAVGRRFIGRKPSVGCGKTLMRCEWLPRTAPFAAATGWERSKHRSSEEGTRNMATLDTQRYELHMPSRRTGAALDQDEEWCEIGVDGERRRIRLHDYAAIYEIPGLYEQLFAERLECTSPQVVCDLLRDALEYAGADPAAMAVLDFGAGNGMIGELLDEIGFARIVGVDLLPEARAAALRDR